jgi:hypothetical protein
VNQSGLNNNYKLNSVRSHDHPGWDEGLFTTPSAFRNTIIVSVISSTRKKGLAFEINFDHTKHIIQDGQQVSFPEH